ncbi:MAG: PQQ-binding-like beta-propeller repeat protein [Acidobacteria bacterium]|nr:PQQ-binding-like beta-propeller repeat protein [Acidobacteriota bacterium]
MTFGSPGLHEEVVRKERHATDSRNLPGILGRHPRTLLVPLLHHHAGELPVQLVDVLGRLRQHGSQRGLLRAARRGRLRQGERDERCRPHTGHGESHRSLPFPRWAPRRRRGNRPPAARDRQEVKHSPVAGGSRARIVCYRAQRRSPDMHHSIPVGRRASLLAATLLLATAGPVAGQSPADAEFVPVTDAMLQSPADGDWLMWRRTLDGWGYSPLDQIDRDNVGDLRMVWTRALGPGAQQGTPIAYGGTLYMPNPNDVIQAIDAVTGDLQWEYHRDIPDDVNDYLGGLISVNRNIAIWDDMIIDTANDDYAFALNATTGELVWETQLFDYTQNPARHSAGPIVADGKVISGRSCRPRRGPEACVIMAHDARTGEEIWRRRLIPAPGEPGDESWGGVPYEERAHVGSWMVPSFDPELNLVYVGTSVTSPAPKFMLGGVDNKHLYHNSTLALDADTGEIVWYYQHLNDSWDLDHPFERLLVDTAVAPDASEVTWINPRIQPGEVRRVVTGVPGKTGVVYTLDRETGEFLWARNTVTQNVISDIDGATGAVTENAELVFSAEGQEVLACPTWNGGKDWEAGAYSPLTNTMYMPLRNACARMLATTAPGTSHYALAVRNQIAPGTDQVGTVHAISAETGETVWLHEQRAATMSLVATGGGLVFGGDNNGRFKAWDQETGEVLWEINLGSAVTSFPISYAVDGKQYIAVGTGTASTASLFGRLTPEIRPSAGNNLFVFALP